MHLYWTEVVPSMHHLRCRDCRRTCCTILQRGDIDWLWFAYGRPDPKLNGTRPSVHGSRPTLALAKHAARATFVRMMHGTWHPNQPVLPKAI